MTALVFSIFCLVYLRPELEPLRVLLELEELSLELFLLLVLVVLLLELPTLLELLVLLGRLTLLLELPAGREVLVFGRLLTELLPVLPLAEPLVEELLPGRLTLLPLLFFGRRLSLELLPLLDEPVEVPPLLWLMLPALAFGLTVAEGAGSWLLGFGGGGVLFQSWMAG